MDQNWYGAKFENTIFAEINGSGVVLKLLREMNFQTRPTDKNTRRNDMGAENTEYGADQIQILEDWKPYVKRPGMYIGSTSAVDFIISYMRSWIMQSMKHWLVFVRRFM